MRIELWRINWWLRFVGLIMVVECPTSPDQRTAIRVQRRTAALRKQMGGVLVGDKDYAPPGPG